MECSQTINDFSLNLERINSSNIDEQHSAVVWILRFIRSADVFTTCCQILSSSLDENVKLQSLKVVQKKIKCTQNRLNRNDLIELYNFLIDYLSKMPSIEITTQICIVFTNLFERIDVWKVHLGQMVQDILTSVTKSSTIDNVFLLRAGVILLSELFSDMTKPHYKGAFVLRLKVKSALQQLNDVLIIFFNYLATESHYLKKILNIFIQTTRFDPPHKCHMEFYIDICHFLRTTDFEYPTIISDLVRFIEIFIYELWPPLILDNKVKYRMYLPLAKGLEKYVEPAIQSNNHDLVYSITSLVANLALICFQDYIHSDIETDYTFLEVLNYICKFNDIEIYDKMMVFWSQFRNLLWWDTRDKFHPFVHKYCDIFLNQILEASFLFQPIRNEYSTGHMDNFGVEFWRKVGECLQFIFQVTDPEPYLTCAISIIHTCQNDYSYMEPSIFFISTLIATKYRYNVVLDEVCELILTIPSDAPQLLIKTSFRFLTNFIRNRPKSPDTPKISFYPIIKWFTRMSVCIFPVEKFGIEPDEGMLSDTVSACNFLNQVLVLFRGNNEIKNLSRIIRDEIALVSEDNKSDVFKNVYNYLMNSLLKDIQNDKDIIDSNFPLFILTEIRNLVESMLDIYPTENDWDTIEKTLDWCFKIIDHFKENEEVRDKACEFVRFLVDKSKGFYPHFKILCEKLVKSYQDMNLSCFLNILHLIFEFYVTEAERWECYLPFFKLIFEHGLDLLVDKCSDTDPIHVSRLMKLFRSVLERKYDDVLAGMEIGRLVAVSADGLLSDNESIFKEHLQVLQQLFERSTTADLKNRPETDFAVIRLYRLHAKPVVKSCLEVILSRRSQSFVEGCGSLLHTMHSGEKTIIGIHVKIIHGFLFMMWKNHSNAVDYGSSILDRFIKLINVSDKDEAIYLATEINSELYGY